MVHPQQPQARLSTRPSILPSSLIHPSQQPHNRPLTRPLTSSVHPHLLTTHPPRTAHLFLFPCVVLNLWLPAFTAHMLNLHVGPPGLFSVFHQSTHLSVPPSLHPFILLVLLLINPSAQHPSLYSVLYVLVWPTLLTTETLNPRPRDPQETKSPCVGHGRAHRL